MSAESSDELLRIAEAVSDGTPVAWDQEKTARPDREAALAGLSVLERLRRTHAEAAAEADAETTAALARSRATPDPALRARPAGPILFRWGPLQVIEKIGEGTGGEVYRAYDPSLDTEIALKLRRPDDEDAACVSDQFIAEARRLARVRHANVLVVHGADHHDGRTGIWTDFVRGKSLEEYLRQQGKLGAREATLIGLELCGALAAVHAAGLAHRDVKTSNVMREDGGRIVLMDFGCVSDLPEPGDVLTDEDVRGTPVAMAPEQIRGERATPASDIYSLGVLLYRLVTGRYPIEARTFFDLVGKSNRGERVPLRDRRADLPLDFVQVVERALAHDPARRFATVGAMERALAATLGAGDPSSGGAGRPRLPVSSLAMAGGVVALVALALIIVALNSGFFDRFYRPSGHAASPGRDESPVPGAPGGSGATRPATPLRADASLYRKVGTRVERLAPGAAVKPGDMLSLVVQGNEPMHAYVLNEDAEGAVYALFPVPGLSPTNPLTAGITYRLPGQMGDSLMYWIVTSAGGRESIVVIGSRDPIDGLERAIASVPKAEPGRAIQYGRVSGASLRSLRGIGGMKSGGTVSQEVHAELEEAIQAMAERAKRKGDVWVWETHLRNPAP